VAVFEPAPVELVTFILSPSVVTITNTNRHVRSYVLGTAVGEITVGSINDPDVIITVNPNMWTPEGPALGLVIGVRGGATVTEARTVVVEVTRQGVTETLTVNIQP